MGRGNVSAITVYTSLWALGKEWNVMAGSVAAGWPGAYFESLADSNFPETEALSI